TPATLRLDACVAGLEVVWREARLIGRVSHAYDEPFAVLDAHGSAACGSVVLPGDVHVGDRIAFPCPGCHTVGDVLRHDRRGPLMLLHSIVYACRCARVQAEFEGCSAGDEVEAERNS
ncbi:hypothetical protein NS283_18055, partial [Microbacterium testaceum]